MIFLQIGTSVLTEMADLPFKSADCLDEIWITFFLIRDESNLGFEDDPTWLLLLGFTFTTLDLLSVAISKSLRS